MTHKSIRIALCRAVVAMGFVAMATSAQAVFISGDFDPPDLSGTHTFQLLGSSCFAMDGPTTVNNSSVNDCQVTLTRLTVLLDHSFPLNYSSFIPFSGIDSILIQSGKLTGVHTSLIGPATVDGGIYDGSWWIQYYYNSSSDPVDLFHNCMSSECVVDTAFTVTFFTSDANGNPIPEPGSLLLLVAALGAGWVARRRAAA